MSEIRVILEKLDSLVRQTNLDIAIQKSKELLAQDESLLAGAVPVPLSKFGAGLPEGIGSARVFALRANTSFKTERHPNSLQRVLSLEGDGKILVKDGVSQRIQALTSSMDARLEQRWASLGQNIWHQPQAGSQDWVVLTFHEVKESELVDEYQD
jgi:hypothetical protein